VLYHGADPAHPGGDEREIGQRAYRDDHADAHPAQSLAQQVGVLRADHDDQGESGQQPVDSVGHGFDARRPASVKANECFY
jgi:hypothetical protein